MSAGLHILATEYSCPLFPRRRTTTDPRRKFGKKIRGFLSLDSAIFFRYCFVNAWLVGIEAPTQLVWVEPVILH